MTSKAVSEIKRPLALSNEAYDSINKIITIVVPALLAFYAVIADTFSIPNTDKVTIVVGAGIVLVKSLLEASKRAYVKSGAAAAQAIEDLGVDGTLNVDTGDPNKDVFQLDVGDKPLLDLANQKTVILKVKDNTDPRLLEGGSQ